MGEGDGRRKQREAMKRKRERQVRNQRILFAEGLVLGVLLLALFSVVIYGKFQEKKEKEAVQQAAASHGKAFAGWLVEEYPDKVSELYAGIREGKLSEKVIYRTLGESVQVLKDRKAGYLKDEKTAAKHQIYIKDGKKGGEAEVTVAGDLCLTEDDFVIDHYDEVKDLKKCISPELLKLTNETDIFYLNHEYCVSDRGEPLDGKLYTFRAKPERMELLKEMGTDLVSLANNHVYDYGEEALLDTLDHLQKDKIPYVGGGRDQEESDRPVYFIVNGIKVGFVAATNAEIVYYTPAATEDSPGVLEAYDTTKYNQIMKEASQECDYLIAYIHWGPEDTNQYADYQAAQGREFLASGADIVVGGHPHVLQGLEYVDGKPIIYSMGDYWFNHETKYTGLLKLKITYKGLKEMSFVPCLQTDFTTQYLKEEKEQREMYDFLQGLSPNAVIDDDGVITESQ